MPYLLVRPHTVPPQLAERDHFPVYCRWFPELLYSCHRHEPNIVTASAQESTHWTTVVSGSLAQGGWTVEKCVGGREESFLCCSATDCNKLHRTDHHGLHTSLCLLFKSKVVRLRPTGLDLFYISNMLTVSRCVGPTWKVCWHTARREVMLCLHVFTFARQQSTTNVSLQTRSGSFCSAEGSTGFGFTLLDSPSGCIRAAQTLVELSVYLFPSPSSPVFSREPRRQMSGCLWWSGGLRPLPYIQLCQPAVQTIR